MDDATHARNFVFHGEVLLLDPHPGRVSAGERGEQGHLVAVVKRRRQLGKLLVEGDEELAGREERGKAGESNGEVVQEVIDGKHRRGLHTDFSFTRRVGGGRKELDGDHGAIVKAGGRAINEFRVEFRAWPESDRWRALRAGSRPWRRKSSGQTLSGLLASWERATFRWRGSRPWIVTKSRFPSTRASIKTGCFVWFRNLKSVPSSGETAASRPGSA